MVSFIIIFRGMCTIFARKNPVFHAVRIGTGNEIREKVLPGKNVSRRINTASLDSK